MRLGLSDLRYDVPMLDLICFPRMMVDPIHRKSPPVLSRPPEEIRPSGNSHFTERRFAIGLTCAKTRTFLAASPSKAGCKPALRRDNETCCRPSGRLDIFRCVTKYKAMRDCLAIAKALSDSNRLRVVLALRRRELCVCQVTALLRLAPSTVSKHLAILQHARLVESRKDERWVYYRWPDGRAPVVVREALDWVFKSLRNDPGISNDSKRLEAILRQNPKVLCQRQTRR